MSAETLQLVPLPHSSPSLPCTTPTISKKIYTTTSTTEIEWERERVRETHSQVPKEVEKTSPFRFVCLQWHPPPPLVPPHSSPLPFVDGPSLDAYRAVRRRACQYSLFICISSSWHIDLSNNFWYIYQFLLPTVGEIALFLPRYTHLLYLSICVLYIPNSRYFFNCIFE